MDKAKLIEKIKRILHLMEHPEDAKDGERLYSNGYDALRAIKALVTATP